VFGRERRNDEEFGIFRNAVIAQTTDRKIKKVCQDGGVVTTLLVYALNEGLIDGAVLSGASEIEPLKAIPKLATSTNEIIGCAGTRYTYSPSMLALKEGILQKKKSLAFVGTPDQIQAFRRIQALPLKKYSGTVTFTVGVFCSECFAYEGLVKRLIQKELGIDTAEVTKINIKGKLLVTTKSGKVEEIRLKEVKQHVRNCITQCSDFSAELADISVGGLGLEGWTFTILRTEKGLDLFQEAEAKGLILTRRVKEEPQVLDLLIKMSKRKRENAANISL
jgi:coenzyme F420 hydrogenase subunit beta